PSDAVVLTLDNNLIADNKASGEGGGFTAAGMGMLYGSLSGSTIASNQAGAGAGAGVTINPSVQRDPAFTLRDLVVSDNVSDDSAGAVSPIYSDVGGGAPPGIGNISADPGFLTGLRGRFYLTQNDPNAPTSPAVDSGSASAATRGNDALTTSVSGVLDAG